MTASIHALVFDLDGTLVDSRRDIAAAVNHTLVTSGRPSLPEATIASFVGDGAIALLERATQLARDAHEFSSLLDRFRSYYTTHATVFTHLYPGVRETLTQLAHLPFALALCTNKPRVATERVLLELDLERYFEVVVCADDLPFHKPHPLPLQHIAERFALKPSELVMIGDGPQDVQCGKAAGARTVGVTYGLKGPSEVTAARPDALIDTIDGIWRFLDDHGGSLGEKLDDRACPQT